MKQTIAQDLNKMFIKINIIFAYIFAFFPILVSLFFSLVDLGYFLILFAGFYFCFMAFRLIEFFLHKDKKEQFINFIKKPGVWIAFALFLTILISAFINGFNINTLVYFSYIAVFSCFFTLKKEQIMPVLNTILIIIAICCVMGFIDPKNTFMPGFNKQSYPLALQFFNPNYSGYVVCMLLVVVIGLLYSSKTKKQHIFYGIIFCVFSFFIFLNGSFAPITAVFVVVLGLVAFYWVKDKKFPLKLFIIWLLLIPFAFLVELYPNVSDVRTCEYNYFLEVIAVFDNIFGTDLLSLFNIEFIMGSDGWERDELLAAALKSITESPIAFMFGHGAGFYNQIRPHNNYLSVWIDCGVFTLVLYLAMLVFIFVKYFKQKKTKRQIIFPFSCFAFLFVSFFGSLIYYSYIYFLVVFAITAKIAFQKPPQTQPEQPKPLQIEYKQQEN